MHGATTWLAYSNHQSHQWSNTYAIEPIPDTWPIQQTDSSTVALAWLKAQPGVQSVIVGALTLEQLDGNLEALDLTLTPEQIATLSEVSKPILNFPADFLTHSPSYSHAGATVNGVASQRAPLVPKDDGSRW